MLRSYFARTHGCLSICHYLLGIGDRHLSNIMVDLETGGVIGIDFGHAFGSATQVSTNFYVIKNYMLINYHYHYYIILYYIIKIYIFFMIYRLISYHNMSYQM